MLLNHTSGIFNFTEDTDFLTRALTPPTPIWTPLELVQVATAHPPTFAPGAGWSYSNTNYVLVGMILTKVTGVPVARLLERRITGPLGLRNTYLADTAAFTGPYAHGYLPPSLLGTTDYLDVSDLSPNWVSTAGAVVSTAPDLARFYRALLGGRLLSPPLLREMKTTVPAADGLNYGLGLFSVATGCGTLWGHDGSVPGYLSSSYTDDRGRRSFVLLMSTQADDATAAALTPVAQTAICHMFGRPVPTPTPTPAPTPTPTTAPTLAPVATAQRWPVATIARVWAAGIDSILTPSHRG
jgi:D-alanyl-D-alanine carboxypeptidase